MTVQFATIFKSHFWDSDVADRFERLKHLGIPGDTWLVFDETHGPAPGAGDHNQAFATSERQLAEIGLHVYPAGLANWYNNDYQAIAFWEKIGSGRYDYLVVAEHDVVVQAPLPPLVQWCFDNQVDLLAAPVRQPMATWSWRHTCDHLWPMESLQAFLLCFSVFSARALQRIGEVRRVHRDRLVRGELKSWPFCEGFVPMVLRDAGLRIASLDALGDMSAYDWWPPIHSSEVPRFANQLVLHPVLSGRRYVQSTLRYWDAVDWFDSDSLLRSRLSLEPPDIVLSELFASLEKAGRVDGLIELLNLCRSEGNDDLRLRVEAALKQRSVGSPLDLASSQSAHQSSNL